MCPRAGFLKRSAPEHVRRECFPIRRFLDRHPDVFAIRQERHGQPSVNNPAAGTLPSTCPPSPQPTNQPTNQPRNPPPRAARPFPLHASPTHPSNVFCAACADTTWCWWRRPRPRPRRRARRPSVVRQGRRMAAQPQAPCSASRTGSTTAATQLRLVARCNLRRPCTRVSLIYH